MMSRRQRDKELLMENVFLRDDKDLNLTLLSFRLGENKNFPINYSEEEKKFPTWEA